MQHTVSVGTNYFKTLILMFLHRPPISAVVFIRLFDAELKKNVWVDVWKKKNRYKRESSSTKCESKTSGSVRLWSSLVYAHELGSVRSQRESRIFWALSTTVVTQLLSSFFVMKWRFGRCTSHWRRKRRRRVRSNRARRHAAIDPV